MTFDSKTALALAEQLEQADRAMTKAPWRKTEGYVNSQAGHYADDVSVIEDETSDAVIEHVYYDGHHTIMRPRDVDGTVALRNLAASCARALREAVEEVERLQALAGYEQHRSNYARADRDIVEHERDAARASCDRLRALALEACDIADYLDQYVPKFPAEGGPTQTQRRLAEIKKEVGNDV